MAKQVRIFSLLLAIAVLLQACAQQPPPASYGDVPGFWLGLAHGFISLFSLIGSVFWDIRVYAYPNNGGWYDFGFVVGLVMFYGGSASQT